MPTGLLYYFYNMGWCIEGDDKKGFDWFIFDLGHPDKFVWITGINAFKQRAILLIFINQTAVINSHIFAKMCFL